jgi:hypothetical protein
MWPLPPIRDDVVSVIISPTQMHCGWLNFDAKKGLRLIAFKSYSLECAHQISIYHHLADFVEHYKLTDAFLSIALASPLMHEEFLRLSKASPDAMDFNAKQFNQLLWDYQYLHALDDGNHLFYLKGIKKPHYFEYQLLAHQTDLKLITLTSSYAAQMAAYKQLYGKAFRQSQLALDLAKHNYNIASCLSRDNIARLVHVYSSASDAWHFKEVIAAMIGSYYLDQRSV